MPTLTLEDFINETIIRDLGVMVYTPELKYLSFIVMSSAIEFLGACLDNKDFNVEGRVKTRFEYPIKFLRSFSSYKSYLYNGGQGYDIYKELRCGLIHNALPMSKIELIQRAEIKSGIVHLREYNFNRKTNSTRLVLVCENLYDDIKAAATETIEELKKMTYLHKATDQFMATDI